MCPEEVQVSWEFLKTVSDTLDSYRVRALIDAKKDILEAGIYNESQYYNILFKMFDEERLKYELYAFLKKKGSHNFESLKTFAQKSSIDIYKSYSLLELLQNEKLVLVEELYDEVEGDDDSPPKLIFKDLAINVPEIESIDSIKSVYEPVSTIFESEVCSGCGICAGICPVNCIEINNGFGKIDEDKCIRCGLCYFVCPRSYLPTKILPMKLGVIPEIKEYGNIGYFKEAYSAKTKVKEISEVCQDGGISSTCLHYLFDKNEIDGALGAKMSSDPWRPEPVLLKNKEDIISAAGTKYVNNPNLQLLNQLNGGLKGIAVVGVPCMMQALLKSHIYDIGIPSLQKVKYRIGIFCMESFPYEDGFLKILEKLNVSVDDVKKTDINKGKFIVYTKSGDELNIPIKEISNLAREDCEVCFDLSSESADISIGSIGSPSGWNTVIIRTEKGKELYDELLKNGLIESKPIKDVKPGLPMLQKIAGFKRNGCKKHISAKKEKNKRYPQY